MDAGQRHDGYDLNDASLCAYCLCLLAARAINTCVRTTVGVGSVKFWNFSFVLARGGPESRGLPAPADQKVPWQSVWPAAHARFALPHNAQRYPGEGLLGRWFHCAAGTHALVPALPSTALTAPCKWHLRALMCRCIASIYTLLHGIVYLIEFSFSLPDNTAASALLLLISIIVLFPTSAFTIIRIKAYSLFRYIHYLGPLILILSLVHIISLNPDPSVNRGMIGTLIWVTIPAVFWIVDFVWATFEAWFCKVTVLEGPSIIPAASNEPAYICVTLAKNGARYWGGCWLSVATLAAKSPISHPFTAIVQHCGGVDKQPAKVFVFGALMSGASGAAL